MELTDSAPILIQEWCRISLVTMKLTFALQVLKMKSMFTARSRVLTTLLGEDILQQEILATRIANVPME